MTEELVQEAAFAIYADWTREPDPRRARQRFDNLKPVIREHWESQAKACIRICEIFGMEFRT